MKNVAEKIVVMVLAFLIVMTFMIALQGCSTIRGACQDGAYLLNTAAENIQTQ